MPISIDTRARTHRRTPRRTAALTALLLAAGLGLATGGGASATSTVDQEQNLTGNNCCGRLSIHSEQSIAQTFTAGRTGTLDNVLMPLGMFGYYASSPLDVAIHTVGSDGSPDTSDEALAAAEVFGAQLPYNEYVWTQVDFDEAPKVVAGRRYAIVATSSVGSASSYAWDFVAADTYYDRGAAWRNTGGGWTEPYTDMAFRTYVDPAPGIPGIRNASSGRPGGAVTAKARWSAPLSSGNGAITSYKVQALKLNSSDRVLKRVTKPAKAGARVLTMRLSKGRYTFRVAAVNRKGTSPWSARSNIVQAR